MNGKHYLQAIAVIAGSVLAAGTVRAQDIEAGKTIFAQCVACHSTDGSNGAGPSLKGVVGRKAGSFEGFRYSRAMKNAGTTWDAASLRAFVADAQKAMPGNVMPYPGIADAKQVDDVVAYIATLR